MPPGLVVAAALLCALWPGHARADGGQAARSWPVAGAAGAPRPVVLRGWDPPATPWAAGHRGLDLGTAPGEVVRAVAAGRVSFAGPVAGRGVVVVTLTGTGAARRSPLRVTYQPVRASVAEGDAVRAGEVVGRVESDGFHCARACLHWGVLRGERYLDPLSLLPEWVLRAGSFRLLPFTGVPVPTTAETATSAETAASAASAATTAATAAVATVTGVPVPPAPPAPRAHSAGTRDPPAPDGRGGTDEDGTAYGAGRPADGQERGTLSRGRRAEPWRRRPR